jgi:hypothetical protein
MRASLSQKLLKDFQITIGTGFMSRRAGYIQVSLMENIKTITQIKMPQKERLKRE